MTEQETLYSIALSFVPRMNLLNRKMLFENLGSATEIFQHRQNLKDIVPNASNATLEALAMIDIHLKRAEEELAFAQAGHIQCIGYNDEAYPARLRECPDAPLLLYYRGTASLNSQHIISMVGGTGITKVIRCTECTSVPVTGGQLCCTELQLPPWGKRSNAKTLRAVLRK